MLVLITKLRKNATFAQSQPTKTLKCKNYPEKL